MISSFIEKLENEPAKYLPDVNQEKLSENVVSIDLNKPMSDILKDLSLHSIKTRLSLTGTMIVARDIAHSKIKDRLDSGKEIPDYFKKHHQ